MARPTAVVAASSASSDPSVASKILVGKTLIGLAPLYTHQRHGIPYSTKGVECPALGCRHLLGGSYFRPSLSISSKRASKISSRCTFLRGWPLAKITPSSLPPATP